MKNRFKAYLDFQFLNIILLEYSLTRFKNFDTIHIYTKTPISDFKVETLR